MHHAGETLGRRQVRFVMRSNFITKIIDLLFPPKCATCGKVIPCGAVCDDCVAKYEEERKERCQKCNGSAASCRCSNISPTALSFYGGYYSEEGRVTEKLVYSLKRNYNKALTEFFAERLAKLIREKILYSEAEASEYFLTFPPRSEASLRKYGFDHVEMLCGRVSALTGIRLEKIFKRVGGTEQKKLDTYGRNENAVSTLYVRRGAEPSGKRFIIIDDVVTTGATVGYASRLLKRGGAMEVRVVSLTRTGKK